EQRTEEVPSKLPFPYPNLAEVVNHIALEENLVGIYYSGTGSDYDDVGDSLPAGRKDLSTFFFQAEDGIRGFYVTGVQTCALPISILLIYLESFLRKAGTQEG